MQQKACAALLELAAAAAGEEGCAVAGRPEVQVLLDALRSPVDSVRDAALRVRKHRGAAAGRELGMSLLVLRDLVYGMNIIITVIIMSSFLILCTTIYTLTSVVYSGCSVLITAVLMRVRDQSSHTSCPCPRCGGVADGDRTVCRLSQSLDVLADVLDCLEGSDLSAVLAERVFLARFDVSEEIKYVLMQSADANLWPGCPLITAELP